jgi:uncharacterized protein YjbI with pentapeptide repeats
MARTSLNEAKLIDCDLRNVNLFHSVWYDASLKNVDLRGADLRNSSFGGASLEGVNLQGALLDRALFQDARLIEVNLTNQRGERKFNVVSLQDAPRFLGVEFTDARGVQNIIADRIVVLLEGKETILEGVERIQDWFRQQLE